MDAALVAAYQQPGPISITLVRFDLPGAPLCLCDGGFARFDAGEGGGLETYVVTNPDVAMLASVGTVKDGAESETTRVNIVLEPVSDEAGAMLASPALQDTRVQWWEGVLHPVTGLLDGQPELKFDGLLDRPTVSFGVSRPMTFECGTQAERQLEPNEDWRLNDAFTRLTWPGDAGCANVTGVLNKDEWRERPESSGLFKRLLGK